MSSLSCSTIQLQVVMGETDIHLMERLRDDDQAEAALMILVERYQNELVGFFYNHCWDQHSAEDLAQTVFLKIYQARHRYKASASVRTFLYRIAHNALVDFKRREKNRKAQSLDAERGEHGLRLVDTLRSEEQHPEADLDRDYKRNRISDALEGLSEAHRSVFIMANNQGLRYQEIAEILDIPEGTVKSRMHIATRKLREVLADLVEV